MLNISIQMVLTLRDRFPKFRNRFLNIGTVFVEY